MKPLLILVVLAAASLAAYFTVSQKDIAPEGPAVKVQDNDTTKDLAYIDPTLPSQGVPPTGEPEFDAQLTLEKVGNQHRFKFKISEKHGWAANAIYVTAWHQSKDASTGEWVKDSRETNFLVSNSPLRFNQVLEYATTVAVYEFPELKDFGTSENWAAKVKTWSDLTAPKP